MAAYKLLLHPKDPACCVATAALAESLQSIGLIGAAARLSAGIFYPAGEHFLELVTFLGCSPAIELDPPADPGRREAASASGSFCHVFLESSPAARFRGDEKTPPPRCPHCGSALDDWPALRAAWLDGPAPAAWTCNACGQSGQPAGLSFRKTAGVASSWVEIRGVYPSEAVPGDALLQRLRELSGCEWAAIYLQE